MADQRVQMLLERNRNINTPLSPPALVDVRKKIRSSGAGGLVISIHELYQSKAAIIRNAGGRASDALRSIATLDAIGGLSTIIVVHHTDCGTTLVLDEEVRDVLRKRAPERSAEIDKMTFGEITDVDGSIKEDVALLKAWPFLGKETNVLGFSLDIKTGLLTEVKDEKSNEML